MGSTTWGKAAAGALLAAAMMTTSACGGDAEAGNKPAASPSVPSVTAAAETFQDAVVEFDSTDGCPQATGECWDKMQAIAEPAGELRKAMNADAKAGPEFYSPAYALLDKIEEGMSVGSDTFTNRPLVLGSAHELSRWLDEHPVQ
ncbi:hypothetical protein [Streptomyces sp. PBH53]|uniref:hypothetical protein n=1 Tax=Streptomyces sp. PBH53 TaxID=1577075 RepID=UPI001AD84131|nr:hypothetical protein [Streptomyces sp. PBH53]